MSAFSRGLSGILHQQSLRLPCSIRIALFSARSQFSQSRVGARLPSPSLLRQYIKPTQIARAAVRGSTRSYISADPVIRSVLKTGEPVLLYKAPSRQLYTVGVYGFACSLVGAGLYTLKWRYELPTELPFFVGPTYVLVGGIMLAIGAYIFSAPVARCMSIELIPASWGGANVQLRIRARTVPFYKDKIILAAIGEPTVNEKTFPVARELIEADRARKQDITEGLRGMFIVRRMWEIGARWLDQKWTSFFLRFKFAVLRFGIVKLYIDGDTWKIDCSGYMLENGKGTC